MGRFTFLQLRWQKGRICSAQTSSRFALAFLPSLVLKMFGNMGSDRYFQCTLLRSDLQLRQCCRQTPWPAQVWFHLDVYAKTRWKRSFCPAQRWFRLDFETQISRLLMSCCPEANKVKSTSNIYLCTLLYFFNSSEYRSVYFWLYITLTMCMSSEYERNFLRNKWIFFSSSCWLYNSKDIRK